MLTSKDNEHILIYRARQMISLAGEKVSRGEDLNKSLDILEDAAIITNNGIICAIDKWNILNKPVNAKIVDLGDVCIAPSLVNAHCHLQLSGLKGKTVWQKGFVTWLKSLVPQLVPLFKNNFDELAISDAVQEMKKSGTACVGDFTSAGHGLVESILKKQNISALSFLEYFGYANDDILKSNYDLKLQNSDLELNIAGLNSNNIYLNSNNINLNLNNGDLNSNTSDLELHNADSKLHNADSKLHNSDTTYIDAKCIAMYASTYAGHALYSTDPKVLVKLKKYCDKNQLIFSMHLAESLDEENALLNGRGDLVDFYAQRILPKGWVAPKMRPVDAAKYYGLLGNNSLMVHGVHVNESEAAYLAQSDTSLCLCPRSNNNLGVGMANVDMLIKVGISLCLGTDGLSSVDSLDLWEDIKTLYAEQNISFRALLRMATINGACCLGFSEKLGSLECGKYFSYSIVPSYYE